MASVNVGNISAETPDAEIKEFFTFCGKIANINVTPGEKTKTAIVTFEKETAMKTALLLNNTQLGPNQITVATDSPVTDDDHNGHGADHDSDEITQEQKPRSRILAEYLAHGYVIGDVALNRALELDSKHGVSTRFMNTLQRLDGKYRATDQVRATDQSYGISQKAGSWLNSLGSYFEKAGNTPTGQKLVKFYTDGQRQVQDIHNEAKRLAELKKDAHGGSAYKASGLERVFGKEKESPSTSTGATTGGVTSSTDASATPSAPASDQQEKPTV